MDGWNRTDRTDGIRNECVWLGGLVFPCPPLGGVLWMRCACDSSWMDGSMPHTERSSPWQAPCYATDTHSHTDRQGRNYYYYKREEEKERERDEHSYELP
mmetsp:Transcript_6351/g.18304  ORF Transcript_6351/g.18304 Transcript_6351/m.18304 type:complete len:100 (-) Transcript_6351:124-423(-)